MRLLFDDSLNPFDPNDLFSVTFVWIVPILIGLVPQVFATTDQLKKPPYVILRPVAAVFLVFVFCFCSRLEDVICLLILGFPFMLGAALSGLVISTIIGELRGSKNVLVSLLIVPIICGLAEGQLPLPSEDFSVESSVVIDARPEEVWENIVRVRRILPSEYQRGLFNYLGIPIPLYAELDGDTVGALRIGHFDNGLQFNERVIAWERNTCVSFDINIAHSSNEKTPFYSHILNGEHFSFVNATYRMLPHADGTTTLSLVTTYRLRSHLNWYGSLWGTRFLSDFQERLLNVIQRRCSDPTHQRTTSSVHIDHHGQSCILHASPSHDVA